MKKGHKRKNWTERWFILQPNSLSYYDCEDLVEKKGNIILDRNCCVEVKKNLLLFNLFWTKHKDVSWFYIRNIIIYHVRRKHYFF